MKKILSICIVFTALMIMVETHAASFNCNKAQTSTEHRICNTLSLNDADVKMVTTYNIVRRLVPMGTRSEIRSEQVRWLELRDECQDNIECLKHVYEMRQQKLDMYMDRVYRQGPF